MSIQHFQTTVAVGTGFRITCGVTGATVGYVEGSIGSIQPDPAPYKAGRVGALTTGSTSLAFRVRGAGDQGAGYVNFLSVNGPSIESLSGADANYQYSSSNDSMSWTWTTAAGWSGTAFINGQQYAASVG